jgi:hypothetical protein
MMVNWKNAFFPEPTPLQKLLLSIAAFVLAFAAGYACRWHFERVDDAKTEGKQEAVTTTATATVKATDKQEVARLNAALAASEQRAKAFEKQLKEYADANPADPSCRLPDRLRDQLNARLTRSGSGAEDGMRGKHR